VLPKSRRAIEDAAPVSSRVYIARKIKMAFASHQETNRINAKLKILLICAGDNNQLETTTERGQNQGSVATGW
jgi:hypothetical protein